ncbi:YpmS family protein [Priestia aryabhattai]|uniref:YpmS family protein n=1 Tax=Priestia aryabhattai TaxID=412384 RepID=UPI0023B1368E|nr:YpmS family protein [Priestia aryabhattai]MDE8674594.1 YpmS family protein [Priestia aryabhattai]
MSIKNRWKIAFFTLLGGIIFIIIMVGNMVVSTDQPTSLPNTFMDNKKSVQFNVSTHKEDINKLLNQYVNITTSYNVRLKDDVIEFKGFVPVLSEKVGVKITFIPKASNNGDLILIPKSFSLGKLNLPISSVLNLVNNSVKLPEWIIIQPVNKVIYVELQKMKINNSPIKIRVNHINLKKDDISLKILFLTDH